MVFLILFAVVILLLLCFFVVPLSVRMRLYFSLERGTFMLRIYALGICVFRARVISGAEGFCFLVNGRKPYIDKTKKEENEGKKGISATCVKEIVGHIKFHRLNVVMRTGGCDAATNVVGVGLIRAFIEAVSEVIKVNKTDVDVVPDFQYDGVAMDASLYMKFNTVKILAIGRSLLNDKKRRTNEYA